MYAGSVAHPPRPLVAARAPPRDPRGRGALRALLLRLPMDQRHLPAAGSDGRVTRILVIDNHDSFVHTLVGYLHELGADTDLVEADAISPAEAAERIAGYDGVLVSPGPGTPDRAGASIAAVRAAADRRIPLLGVCLGHQAIAIGVRRHGRSRSRAHARDHLARPPRRRGALCGAARSVRRHALSLARRGARVRARAARRDESNRAAASSWGFATGSCPSRACSSTPRRCSPRAGTACSATGSRRPGRRMPQPAARRSALVAEAPSGAGAVRERDGRVHRDVARCERLLAHGRWIDRGAARVFDGLNDEGTLGASSSRVAASTV